MLFTFPPSVPQMQYVFIFQALLEHYLYGDTELEVTSLESHLAKLYSPSPGAGCNGLEAEFKVCACVLYSSRDFDDTFCVQMGSFHSHTNNR